MGSCRVKGCKSNSGRKDFDKAVRFFKFPKCDVLCKKWISLCGQEIINLKTATVCSLHFKEEDYTLKDRLLNTPIEKRHLTEDAIPSLHLSDCVQILKYRDENANADANELLRKQIVEEALGNFGKETEIIIKKPKIEAKTENQETSTYTFIEQPGPQRTNPPTPRHAFLHTSKQIRFTWTFALENVLIELWESNIHNLRRTKHNGHVYKSMVEDMRLSSGTIVTVKEITAKIKNLTRRYREEEKKVWSGGGLPSPWPHYEKVNNILGPFPSHNLKEEQRILTPVKNVEPIDLISASPVGATEPNASGSEESIPPLSPVSSLQDGNTSRKSNFLYLLLEELKRSNVKAEQLEKESNELQKTANNLLQKSLEIQDEILKRTPKKPPREIPVDELKKRNKQLHTQLQNLKKSMKSYEQMEKTLSNVFTKGQMEKLKNSKKKQFKWSLDDVLSASCLRSTDHKTYKYLQKNKIPFPKPPTLKRWAMKIEHHPGILLDFIESMEVWKLSDEEKVCILCFDKIKIKSESENDKEKEKGDLLYPSKYVQVVMARGLFKEWKQPVFYAFDCKMSKRILEMIISELYKTGFNVVALVSNISPSIQSLWKELQIGLMKTWFYHPDDAKKRIFVFADAPYLLKMMRNHFIDTGFIIKGKLLNSAPLKKLLASMTRPESEVINAHDITEEQLNVKKASKRKVKRATQLFSNTLSSSLKRCTEIEKSKCSYAIKVANFVKLVNDWIDVLNSNDSAVESCTSVKAFGLALDAQTKILNEMDDAVLHLRIPNQTSLSPFQKGILISNCSLRGIFKYLQMNYTTRCIFAGRLNQDELENLFEAVRVNDKAPTRLEFQYRLWSNFLSGSP